MQTKTSSRSRHLLTKFGITEKQYDDLLRSQDGCCAVCNRPASTFRHKMCIDHDHSSREIRGILCIHCNRYIVGRHRKERGADLLLAAYKYLTKNYTGWIVPPKKKKKKRKRNGRSIPKSR